jgi:membrane protein required for colicin V production
MNWLDAVILIIIIGFTAAAIRAGLIREVITLIAVVMGVLIAGHYYDDLADDVLLFIKNDKAAKAIAFVSLFASVALLGQLAAFLMKQVVSMLLLGWLDHLAGGAFGLLKGLVLVELFLMFFATFPYLGLDDAIDGSGIAPLFLDNGPALLKLLPGEFNQAVEPL